LACCTRDDPFTAQGADLTLTQRTWWQEAMTRGKKGLAPFRDAPGASLDRPIAPDAVENVSMTPTVIDYLLVRSRFADLYTLYRQKE
jgi:hypothetical protein